MAALKKIDTQEIVEITRDQAFRTLTLVADKLGSVEIMACENEHGRCYFSTVHDGMIYISPFVDGGRGAAIQQMAQFIRKMNLLGFA